VTTDEDRVLRGVWRDSKSCTGREVESYIEKFAGKKNFLI